MELHELNRAFDQFSPTPEQREAMGRRLLTEERKVRPMRKLKKLSVALVAAALLLMTCAFAVVSGLDQRLLNYLGADEGADALLSQSAQSLNIQVSDQGAALQVHQVLRDQYSVLVLADFTAPAGTELNADAEYRFSDMEAVSLIDGSGAKMEGGISYYTWQCLEDSNPQDNHLTMLFYLLLQEDAEPASLWLSAQDLVYYQQMVAVPVCSGDWSCEIPLPQTDPGYVQLTSGTVWQTDAQSASVERVYISPISLHLTLERKIDTDPYSDDDIYQEWLCLIHAQDICLTNKDGQTVSLIEQSGGNIGRLTQKRIYRLAEVMDPAQFVGGTITFTLDGQTTTLPLDQLAPVES